MYAVYDRQQRVSEVHRLRKAIVSPFEPRPTRPLENVDQEELEKYLESLDVRPHRKLLHRSQKRKIPDTFYQPPPESGPEPCVFWNWSVCKRGPNCVSLHECSGCRQKGHAAKFCPHIDFDFNWGISRRRAQRSSYVKSRICLGCGGNHPAKQCDKLIEPVKNLFQNFERQRVWGQSSEGFFQKRSRWKRRREARRSAHKMHYSEDFHGPPAYTQNQHYYHIQKTNNFSSYPTQYSYPIF